MTLEINAEKFPKLAGSLARSAERQLIKEMEREARLAALRAKGGTGGGAPRSVRRSEEREAAKDLVGHPNFSTARGDTGKPNVKDVVEPPVIAPAELTPKRIPANQISPATAPATPKAPVSSPAMASTAASAPKGKGFSLGRVGAGTALGGSALAGGYALGKSDEGGGEAPTAPAASPAKGTSSLVDHGVDAARGAYKSVSDAAAPYLDKAKPYIDQAKPYLPAAGIAAAGGLGLYGLYKLLRGNNEERRQPKMAEVLTTGCTPMSVNLSKFPKLASALKQAEESSWYNPGEPALSPDVLKARSATAKRVKTRDDQKKLVDTVKPAPAPLPSLRDAINPFGKRMDTMTESGSRGDLVRNDVRIRDENTGAAKGLVDSVKGLISGAGDKLRDASDTAVSAVRSKRLSDMGSAVSGAASKGLSALSDVAGKGFDAAKPYLPAAGIGLAGGIGLYGLYKLLRGQDPEEGKRKIAAEETPAEAPFRRPTATGKGSIAPKAPRSPHPTDSMEMVSVPKSNVMAAADMRARIPGLEDKAALWGNIKQRIPEVGEQVRKTLAPIGQNLQDNAGKYAVGGLSAFLGALLVHNLMKKKQPKTAGAGDQYLGSHSPAPGHIPVEGGTMPAGGKGKGLMGAATGILGAILSKTRQGGNALVRGAKSVGGHLNNRIGRSEAAGLGMVGGAGATTLLARDAVNNDPMLGPGIMANQLSNNVQDFGKQLGKGDIAGAAKSHPILAGGSALAGAGGLYGLYSALRSKKKPEGEAVPA